jgi:hypothetical protein
MKRILDAIGDLLFPYRHLQGPEYEVSRNLLPWDSMVRRVS